MGSEDNREAKSLGLVAAAKSPESLVWSAGEAEDDNSPPSLWDFIWSSSCSCEFAERRNMEMGWIILF